MSVRKRNEYLEDDASEEESEHGYGFEEEGRAAIGGRASKRRKRQGDNDHVESDGESFHSFDDDQDSKSKAKEAEPEEAAERGGQRFMLIDDLDEENEQERSDEDVDDAKLPEQDMPKKNKAPKSVAAAEKAAKKSGVLYISRVPPFMKPQTLRHYLQSHAPKHGLGRIFLTPEDPTQRTSRLKQGGNKKKSYTDGWVEFVSKKEAKAAAGFLNGEIMGGKKGSFYYDDIWSVRYLRGFKWRDLTDQIANENAEREARMREEIRRTRKENKAFLEDVERGKMLAGIERKGKGKVRDGGAEAQASRNASREFKQRKAQAREKIVKEDGQGGEELKRVLGKIF
ncbi:pre-rrna-processing protein esf2 [Teratosphaeria destructans]|uniref:18S rRNA factor 2 n=1 Tax=Teratosphaeria destructans TaxID=418781 RepID=A0A9W7SNP9_9PEZI|nr:pre-rrna-processing protein esf2 [Teratosphaeria destructans]